MAKTPLLSAIQRLFLQHRALRAAGLPPEAADEMRERARAERAAARRGALSRRAFLGGLGAGAVALGAPRIASAAGSPTVVIVGGGIAGLSCALKLADKGIASTVYEASGRIGGRMFSNNGSYWQNNQVSEWCGELIDTGHKTVQKLAQRFDLPLDDLLAAQPAGSQDTFRFDNGYYTQAQADHDFKTVFDAVSDDLDAAGYPTTFDDFTIAGAQLDSMSIHDWIESRVPGGHCSRLGQLLDIAYNIEYGAETTDQAALNLIYLLGYQPAPKGLAVFGESDERYHIRGGNQRLPEAIASSLGIGSAVKLGYRMTRLKKTAAGRYKVTFESGATTTDVTADYVVLALPFAVLRGLDYSQAGFDALKDEAIQDLGRGHNGKLQLQFSSRLWNQTGPWPGKSTGATYADTGYQASWEVTRAQPGATGILTLYSGGDVTDAMHATGAFGNATAAGVSQDVTKGLTRLSPVFPGLTAKYNGKATQSLPHKSPFFGASYAYFRVGQYTSFAGYEGVKQGGVYFCGEHTSQDYQGFMEGGASEGTRVGKELAQLIK